MIRRIIIVCSLVNALAVTAWAPDTADACSGYSTFGITSPGAEALTGADWVRRHFERIAHGHMVRACKLWSAGATVYSIAENGTVRRQTIRTARARWAKRRDAKWTLGATKTAADGLLAVTAVVTWNGGVYDEVIQIDEGAGRWQLVGTTSIARSAVKTSVTASL